MSATNFNTENRTWRQLIGNGLIYRVPRFQRDYSWGEEEWEDLWTDLLTTFPPDAEPAHYMGYLVLQTKDNRAFEVIDGQQRLTTLSLIVLAAMRLIQSHSEELFGGSAHNERLRILRATYIGTQDPVTLTTHNKLVLNRNNDPYYQTYLTELTPKLPQRGFPPSTQLLRKGFEWFEARLKRLIRDEEDKSKALAQFIDHISDRLFFTVITVSDELNAYKVFETLNARGVRLSSTDLLKNYLFSVLARGEKDYPEVDVLERRWEKIVDRLSSESFPDFLRAHWNSRNSFARRNTLFKTIRSKVTTREHVFELLRALEDDVDAWLALTQPDGSEWSLNAKSDVKNLRMFSVRQPFSMLMAARRSFSEADFDKLLHATTIIAFRYNIIGGQNPADPERHYHNLALQIHQKKATSYRETLDLLRPIYRSDDAFMTDFSEKSIKTTQSRQAKIVRYIFEEFERRLGGTGFDTSLPEYTLEHILPQSPNEGWESFPERDHEAFVYRLGNMVMLEAKLNREVGNAPYEAKREALAQSSLRQAQKLAERYSDWTPDALTKRQQRLAKEANEIWKIPRLSEATAAHTR